MSSSGRPYKGSKTSSACLACKSRRSKCSGTQPCSKCQTLNSECIYDLSNDARRRDFRQQHEKLRERHFELLQDLLSLLRDGSEEHVNHLLRVIREGKALPEIDARVFELQERLLALKSDDALPPSQRHWKRKAESAEQHAADLRSLLRAFARSTDQQVQHALSIIRTREQSGSEMSAAELLGILDTPANTPASRKGKERQGSSQNPGFETPNLWPDSDLSAADGESIQSPGQTDLFSSTARDSTQGPQSILDMNPEDVYVRYPHQPHWTSDAPPLQMNFSNSLSEDSYGQQQIQGQHISNLNTTNLMQLHAQSQTQSGGNISVSNIDIFGSAAFQRLGKMLLDQGKPIPQLFTSEVDLESIFSPSPDFAPTKETTLAWAASWVSQFDKVKSMKFSHRLAIIYIVKLVLQWQIIPSESTYTALPEWLRPTQQQMYNPNHSVIDFLRWPDIRQLFMQQGLRQVPIYVEHIRFAWPYTDRDIFTTTIEGNMSWTESFKQFAVDIQNWSLDPRIISSIPALAGKGPFSVPPTS